MKLRTTTAFAALVLATGSAGAQQTLTFTNTDTDPGTGVQNQVITLLGGSTVSIATNGNLSAQCALTGSLCTGTGSGGGTGVPTVSLVASGFSGGQTASPFDAGTTFTITPTVTNGQICVRSLTTTPASSANTNWPATVLPPFAAANVVIPTPETTYQFTMKCYNDNGSATFTLPNIVTKPGPPPSSCTGFQVPLPAGWSRVTPPASMPDVTTIQGFQWNDFPNGGGRGVIATDPSRYISMRIRTPADIGGWNAVAPQKRVFVDPSQLGGPAIISKIYMSISECAGDFRIPPANASAPATDRTFARVTSYNQLLSKKPTSI